MLTFEMTKTGLFILHNEVYHRVQSIVQTQESIGVTFILNGEPFTVIICLEK